MPNLKAIEFSFRICPFLINPGDFCSRRALTAPFYSITKIFDWSFKKRLNAAVRHVSDPSA